MYFFPLLRKISIENDGITKFGEMSKCENILDVNIWEIIQRIRPLKNWNIKNAGFRMILNS